MQNDGNNLSVSPGILSFFQKNVVDSVDNINYGLSRSVGTCIHQCYLWKWTMVFSVNWIDIQENYMEKRYK